MVSARDWFMISKVQMRGNVWFQGGCSVEYAGGPTGANLHKIFVLRLKLHHLFLSKKPVLFF